MPKQRKAPPKSQRTKRQPKNNGVRYSESDKMVARRIVQAAGGAITDELLEQVKTALRLKTLSWDTLQRWMKPTVEKPSTQAASAESRERKVPVVESVEMDYHKTAAREIVEHTFRLYAKQAGNSTQVEKTEGKDAAKVMESMLKLMQLLDGLPTEIVGITSKLAEVAKRKGYDPTKSIEAMIAELELLPDKEMITSGSGVN